MTDAPSRDPWTAVDKEIALNGLVSGNLVSAARAAIEEAHRQEVSRLEVELQTKFAVEAWPRVAELSNEVIGLKAEVERLIAENARLTAELAVSNEDAEADCSRLRAELGEGLQRDREWLMGAADSILHGLSERTGRPFVHSERLENNDCVTCAGIADDLEELLRGTVSVEASSLTALRTALEQQIQEWRLDAAELDVATDGQWIEPQVQKQCAAELAALLAAEPHKN